MAPMPFPCNGIWVDFGNLLRILPMYYCEKAYFEQGLQCTAPNCWLKYAQISLYKCYSTVTYKSINPNPNNKRSHGVMDKAVAPSCLSHFGGPGFVTQRFRIYFPNIFTLAQCSCFVFPARARFFYSAWNFRGCEWTLHSKRRELSPLVQQECKRSRRRKILEKLLVSLSFKFDHRYLCRSTMDMIWNWNVWKKWGTTVLVHI